MKQNADGKLVYAKTVSLRFTVDERTHRVIVCTVLDNLVKGAAGQAVQNMNLMCGFEETAGLSMLPVYP